MKVLIQDIISKLIVMQPGGNPPHRANDIGHLKWSHDERAIQRSNSGGGRGSFWASPHGIPTKEYEGLVIAFKAVM
jgi:hypothetical protein